MISLLDGVTLFCDDGTTPPPGNCPCLSEAIFPCLTGNTVCSQYVQTADTIDLAWIVNDNGTVIKSITVNASKGLSTCQVDLFDVASGNASSIAIDMLTDAEANS